MVSLAYFEPAVSALCRLRSEEHTSELQSPFPTQRSSDLRAEDYAAAGVALEVAGEIDEIAPALHVRLLGPESANELQFAFEKMNVPADVGGGNGLLGVLRAGGERVVPVEIGRAHV